MWVRGLFAELDRTSGTGVVERTGSWRGRWWDDQEPGSHSNEHKHKHTHTHTHEKLREKQKIQEQNKRNILRIAPFNNKSSAVLSGADPSSITFPFAYAYPFRGLIYCLKTLLLVLNYLHWRPFLCFTVNVFCKPAVALRCGSDRWSDTSIWRYFRQKTIDASFLLNLHHFVSFGASDLHTDSKITSMMCKLQPARCVYTLKHTEVSWKSLARECLTASRKREERYFY